MSTPQYTPPEGFVPPSSQFGQQRSGPGCWVWGLVSCLVIVVIVAAFTAISIYGLMKSPEGKKLVSSMHSAIGTSSKIGVAMQKMHTVHDAVIRYHEKNGVYPPDLSTLVPDYLDSPAELHIDIDPNPTPSHISFAYVRPTANAPGSTVLLSFQWTFTLDVGVQKQTSQFKEEMRIDGSTDQSQSSTMITTPGMSPGFPPPPPPPAAAASNTHGAVPHAVAGT